MSINDRIWDVYADKGKDYDEDDFYLYISCSEKDTDYVPDSLHSISKSLEEGNNEHAAWKIFSQFVEDEYLWPLFKQQNVKELNKTQKAKVLDEISVFWDFVSNFKWCSKPMKNIKSYERIDEDVKAMFFEAVQKHASELGHYESEDDKERFFQEYKSEIKDIFKCGHRLSSMELKKHLQPIANKAVWLKHCDEH